MRRPGLVQALAAALLFLERRVVLAPLIGVLLALPAIGRQRVFDDHVLELVARQSGEAVAPGTGFDLFQFANGRASDNLALMAQGSMLPWWTDPDLKITFYRPLSSLLHRLDFAAWPAHPELAYVHTLLWFGVLLWLVTRLFRSFEPRAALASLAAWLYAVNDAHGTLVGWLSNRNALISAVGAVAALLCHRRARQEGHAPSRIWAPLWLAVALFAGELGASTWAWLIAYALVFEAGPVLGRLRTLWPFAIVTGLWAVLYRASGAGTHASGVYLHPFGDLPGFAAEFPRRALVLLGAAFGPVPAELSFLGPAQLMPLWLGVAVVWLGVLAFVARRVVLRDPVARFWCIAIALGVAPVAASFPSDRLLVLVNIAAMGLVARALHAFLLPPTALEQPALEKTATGVAAPRAALVGAAADAPPGPLARGVGWALLGVHALLAPLLLPLRAHQMQELAQATEHAFKSLDAIPDLDQKTLIVFGAPTDFFVSYLQAERAARGSPRPEHVYWLANPEAKLDLRVVDAHTVTTEREGGFFITPSEALYRKPSSALAVHARVSLPELTASISRVTQAGVPSQVEFAFDEPLTDARYVFLALRGSAYERVSADELDRLELAPALPLSAFLSGSHER